MESRNVNTKSRRRRAALAAVFVCVGATAVGGTAVADVIFDFSPPTTGVKRFYAVIEAQHSGLSLNVPEASTANGTQIIQWNGGRKAMNGQWEQLEPGGTAANNHVLFVFRNRWSRQCLDVDSVAVGAPVVQRPCDGSLSQKWTRENPPGSNPNLATITNQFSKLDLNVSGASTQLGAKLIQWPRSGAAPNALFKITSFNDLHIIE